MGYDRNLDQRFVMLKLCKIIGENRKSQKWKFKKMFFYDLKMCFSFKKHHLHERKCNSLYQM